MKMSTAKSFGVLWIGVVFLAGCAFGDRQVVLDYPPENSSGGGVISVAEAAEPLPNTGQSIVVMKFEDLRSDKRIIGEVRNGWGMRTANVVVANNVSDWLTDAVTMELENQGILVIGSDAAQGSQLPVLDGDILTVYCSAYLEYEGEVSFIARIQNAGVEVLNKRYTATGSVGLNWAATSESYEQSLSLALANAVRDLVSDLRVAL